MTQIQLFQTLLLSSGLTKREVSRRSGVSRVTLDKFFRDTGTGKLPEGLRIGTIRSVAKVFGRDCEVWFGREERVK